MRGISMSRNRISGECRSMRSKACTPLAASPTIRSAGQSSRRCWRNSSRKTVSSSAKIAVGVAMGSSLTLEFENQAANVVAADVLDIMRLRLAPEHLAQRYVVLGHDLAIGGADTHRAVGKQHGQMGRVRVHACPAHAHARSAVVLQGTEFVV